MQITLKTGDAAREQRIMLGGPEAREDISQFCDDVLNEFAASDWYRKNVPGRAPDKYERAMLKTFMAYLVTQKVDLPSITKLQSSPL